MEFNIEKGIIPNKSRILKNTIEKLLPLEQMVPGDSIFVPSSFLRRKSIINKLFTYKKKTNLSFTTQKMVNAEKIEGTRVWRN